MKYTYKHPDYPQTLTVENQWVLDEFATNLVDLGASGGWDHVKRNLNNRFFHAYREESYLDIHERFNHLKDIYSRIYHT